MGIFEKIRAAYPQAVPQEDFRLLDLSDGQGPFLALWNEPKLGPAPNLSTLPDPPVFQGKAVFKASDVDKVTSQRILDYLAPGKIGDVKMQERHIMRTQEDVLQALDIKRDPGSYTQGQVDWADQAIAQARAKRAEIQMYRDEAAAFKAANNLT